MCYPEGLILMIENIRSPVRWPDPFCSNCVCVSCVVFCVCIAFIRRANGNRKKREWPRLVGLGLLAFPLCVCVDVWLRIPRTLPAVKSATVFDVSMINYTAIGCKYQAVVHDRNPSKTKQSVFQGANYNSHAYVSHEKQGLYVFVYSISSEK